jgi:hypothetical protein
MLTELSSVLLFYNTCLALLLRISQTRLGATNILNAGLFQSIRDSQLFSADPDIGLGNSHPLFFLSHPTTTSNSFVLQKWKTQMPSQISST